MLSRLAMSGSLAASPHMTSQACRTFPIQTAIARLNLSSSAILTSATRNNVTLTINNFGRNFFRKVDHNASSILKAVEKLGPGLIPVSLCSYAFLKNGVVRPQCKVKDRRVGMDSADKAKDPPFNWSLFMEFLKPQVREGFKRSLECSVDITQFRGKKL